MSDNTLTCPDCKLTYPLSEFRETDVYCESCEPTDHPGLVCPTPDCYNTYDEVRERWLFNA